jgi:hypothetical protein
VTAAEWLAARRAAAQAQAAVLADEFELANVETISEAPTQSGSPQQVTDHVVAELQRILREHA